MILADFFDTPYQMLVESKYKEYQQQIDDIDIRLYFIKCLSYYI